MKTHASEWQQGNHFPSHTVFVSLPPSCTLRVPSSSEQTSKAVRAKVGNLTSLSTRYWQTVDIRTIECPGGQTQAATATLYYPYTLFQITLPLCFCILCCLSSFMLALHVCGCAASAGLPPENTKSCTCFTLSLPPTLCYALTLYLNSITLITLLIGSCNAPLS